MKFWKALGGVLVFLGCLTALTGILATVAPMIDNDQVRRIIESFSVRTLDPVLNGINTAILFCLRSHTLLFAIGAGALLLGGLMRAAAAGKVPASETHTGSMRQAESAPIAKAPARPARAAAPAPATTPASAAAPKREQSLSPYTAAAYGKALTGGAASDIAAKYMPRSIIDTPIIDSKAANVAALAAAGDAPKASSPESSPSDATYATPAPQEKTDWKSIETIYCAVCGAGNPWQAAFCDQCGNRLAVPDALLALVAKQQPTPIEKVTNEILSRYQSDMEHPVQAVAAAPLTVADAPVQPPAWSNAPEQRIAAVQQQGAPYAAATGTMERYATSFADVASQPAEGQPSAYAESTVQPPMPAVRSPIADAPVHSGYGQPAARQQPQPDSTAGAPPHARIVSTIRRTIAAPSPLVSTVLPSEPAPVRARPRIVSTIGKQNKK